MKNIFIFAIACAMFSMACATATITEPSSCEEQSVSFSTPAVPTIPSQFDSVATCSMYSVNIPDVSTTTTVDLSDAISKLNKVADNLSVAVQSVAIDNSNGEFNWVDSVSVGVSTNNLPMIPIANYTAPTGGPGETIQPDVVISAADSIKYLGNGPATLTVVLHAQNATACQAMVLKTMPSTLSSSANLCVSASGTVSKSL